MGSVEDQGKSSRRDEQWTPEAGYARKRAVAFRYAPDEMDAPQVVARGTGRTAERIIELAREHHVAIKEDPQLVQALSRLEIGDSIPPELYMVVAEVFAWLYELERKAASE